MSCDAEYTSYPVYYPPDHTSCAPEHLIRTRAHLVSTRLHLIRTRPHPIRTAPHFTRTAPHLTRCTSPLRASPPSAHATLPRRQRTRPAHARGFVRTMAWLHCHGAPPGTVESRRRADESAAAGAGSDGEPGPRAARGKAGTHLPSTSIVFQPT